MSHSTDDSSDWASDLDKINEEARERTDIFVRAIDMFEALLDLEQTSPHIQADQNSVEAFQIKISKAKQLLKHIKREYVVLETVYEAECQLASQDTMPLMMLGIATGCICLAVFFFLLGMSFAILS